MNNYMEIYFSSTEASCFDQNQIDKESFQASGTTYNYVSQSPNAVNLPVRKNSFDNSGDLSQ